MGIKDIVYKENNNIFIINMENKTLAYNNLTNVISDDLMINYFETLLTIIDKWQHQYINSIEIIDGTSWQLSINLIDGTKKEYVGTNEFPNNFEAFLRLNQRIIKEVL